MATAELIPAARPGVVTQPGLPKIRGIWGGLRKIILNIDSFCDTLNWEQSQVDSRANAEVPPGTKLASSIKDCVRGILRIVASDRSDSSFAYQAFEATVLRDSVTGPSDDLVRCIQLLSSERGGKKRLPLLYSLVRDAIRERLHLHNTAIGISPDTVLPGRKNPLFRDRAHRRIDLLPPTVRPAPTTEVPVTAEPATTPAHAATAERAATSAAAARARLAARMAAQRKDRLLDDYNTLLSRFESVPEEYQQAVNLSMLKQDRVEQWISCHKRNYSDTLDDLRCRLSSIARELHSLGLGDSVRMDKAQIESKYEEMQSLIDPQLTLANRRYSGPSTANRSS